MKKKKNELNVGMSNGTLAVSRSIAFGKAFLKFTKFLRKYFEYILSRLLTVIRFGALLFLGIIVLRRPGIWFTRLLLGRFDYTFFVYPGQESDIRAYVPKFFVKMAYFRTQIFFGGIITSQKDTNIGRGLLIGAPSTVRSMVKSSAECSKLKKRIKKIAQEYSVKRVALAGRAPSIFLRNKVILDDPFVHGRMGMVFCTIVTLQEIVRKHEILLKTSSIVVFGGGEVGRSIVDFLVAENYKVKSVYSKTVFDESDQLLSETAQDVLGEADIVIVISAKGSDFHPCMKWLKDKAIIVGETHPPIRQPFKNGFIYRAAVLADGLKFTPSLHSYGDGKNIPGCLVEAIVVSFFGSIIDQKTFNEKALEIGFRASVIE